MNQKTHRIAIEKRILNEFSSKILNEERLSKVFESRRKTRLSHHSTMIFHCECDRKACEETIVMSSEEYQQVHRQTKYFVIVPSHIQLDLEEIVTSFNNYILVAKYFPRAKPV